MQKGLPNVCGHEKDTLYILGNGFDLAHKILSKYKHFWCWLNLNGYEDYADILQRIFPQLTNRLDSLWCNFESALDSLDLHYLFKKYVTFPQNGWDEKEWYDSILLGNERVQGIIDNIPILIKEWAAEISINVKPHFSNLSAESKYLSFNYTPTLEQIYNIPPTNICHIHESVKSDAKLIVGFNSPISANNLPAKSDEEEKAQTMFVESQNRLVKPKQQQIEKNIEFFSSLNNTDRIIVIGHSLSQVDLRYFVEVKRSIKDNAKWYFSWFNSDDIERIMHLVKPAKYQQNFIDDYELFDLTNL